MTSPLTLRDVLLQCQTGVQCHSNLIKALKQIYTSMGVDKFWAEFEQLIKFPMVIYNREPTVELTFDFITKFVTSLSTKRTSEDPDLENGASCSPMLQNLFDFLLQHHNSKNRAVRFRTCQMVTKLLGSMGEEATIDDALYDRVFQCMLERLRDKAALVRVHAVLALVRLQDPTDECCPVINAYMFLMTSDPNPEVRKTTVMNIAACRKTLPAILERTRDVKDTVRQAAFAVIAEKVPLKALSISQRVQLLQHGLLDRTESVKKVCGGKLLQSWLRSCEGNVLDLLHSLDVENSTHICQKLLHYFLNESSITDLIANFSLLNDKRVMSKEKLTCESAMYWQEVCCYVHKAGTDFEEYLDMVLPACLDFCAFLDSVLNDLDVCQNLDRQLELEFIIQQLLRLFSCMDLSDQACRNAVEKLLHKMLLSDHVAYSLVPHILPYLSVLHTSTESLIHFLAETVAEIRQPITTVEKSLSIEEQRRVDIQIAKVRVQLNQVREELEESVKNQEFQRAAELKESIHSLEIEKSSLISFSQPFLEEVKVEKNDVVSVMKCLAVICEMLESLPLQSMTSTLHMLVETQILPGMANEEASVRNLAVKAIGICCQLNRSIIKLHLPILIQASQVDVECVRVTAIKSLFDLIHIYGLGAFEVESGDAECVTSSNQNGKHLLDANIQHKTLDLEDDSFKGNQSQIGLNKTVSNLVTILSSMLDNESSELRCVVAEGLSKLLISGRVFSAALLSHLLLVWYNPLAEDDAPLRHTLGTFFPIFAFTDSCNQQLFEEAFIPTLRTLLDAPSTSPLNSVSTSSVADFLVELTHSQRLVALQTSNTVIRDNPCHDSLAVKVCNEILSNPHSIQVRLWTRILNQLNLSPDNQTHLRHMSVFCEKMLKVVKEKSSIKALDKFQKTITNMLVQLSTTEETMMKSITGDQEGRKTDMDQKKDTRDSNEIIVITNTPSMPPPAGSTTIKSNIHRTQGRKLEYDKVNSSIFTTPSQCRALEMSGINNDLDLEKLHSSLDSLLLEGTKTPTHRTPGLKRTLHSIQDSTLL